MKTNALERKMRLIRRGQNMRERQAFDIAVDTAVKQLGQFIASTYYRRGLLVGLAFGAMFGAFAYACAVAWGPL